MDLSQSSNTSNTSSNNINNYLLVFIIVILIILISISIYLLVKQNDKQQTNDENLKIALNIINKENYEDSENNRYKTKCLKLKSALGDSNNKGLNDIYKNIMGKESPLSSSSINCDRINDTEMNKLISSLVTMIDDMVSKSVENKDEEKVYYDLTSLYISLIFLLSDSGEKIKSNLDSNGKIVSVEFKGPDGKELTLSKLLENYNPNRNSNTEVSSRDPEISKKLNDRKTKVSNLKITKNIKEKDIDKLRNDKETKMNINSLGKYLVLVLDSTGTLIR